MAQMSESYIAKFVLGGGGQKICNLNALSSDIRAICIFAFVPQKVNKTVIKNKFGQVTTLDLFQHLLN